MVQSEVRGSKHRDKIEIIPRPAASAKTLLDGLNDNEPQVVHFSGHGGQGGVWFDDGNVVKSIGAGVSFTLLTDALGSVDKKPILLVLNACDTLNGAEGLLDSVAAVVAMSDSISDLGAATFAAQLYAGIAAGQSLSSSLKQAVVAMKAATLDVDAKLPKMIHRADVDPTVLFLVK
jgi:hypothetical protein